MTKFVDRLTAADLLPALDANMAAYWAPYGRGVGCTLQETRGAVWFYTGVPHPLFNGVISAKLAPDEVEATRSALQAQIAARGAPALWWIGPLSKPENLGALLAQSGLQPAGHAPGMAVELGALPEAGAIPGFSIERVYGAAKQRLWARIAAIGAGFPGAAADALERVEASLNDPQHRAQHRYIGMLDGTPVAASALVLEAGVAGIYAVATLPAARNKGIGRFMTLYPLLDARRLGYRVGILQASSMGYPIYEKMGFADVCAYELYMQS